MYNSNVCHYNNRACHPHNDSYAMDVLELLYLGTAHYLSLGGWSIQGNNGQKRNALTDPKLLV